MVLAHYRDGLATGQSPRVTPEDDRRFKHTWNRHENGARAVLARRAGGQQMRAAWSRRSRPRQEVEDDQWLSKVSVNTSVAPPVSSPKTTSVRRTS